MVNVRQWYAPNRTFPASDDVRVMGARGTPAGTPHASWQAAHVRSLENDRSYGLAFSQTEWMMYSPDGYFDASRDGDDLVLMVKGLDAFRVEQFAVRNN